MSRRIRMAELIVIVAEEYGVPVHVLRGPSRYRNVVVARWDFMVRARAQGFSYPHIGQFLGRDHTTVLHGVRMHEAGLYQPKEAA